MPDWTDDRVKRLASKLPQKLATEHVGSAADRPVAELEPAEPVGQPPTRRLSRRTSAIRRTRGRRTKPERIVLNDEGSIIQPGPLAAKTRRGGATAEHRWTGPFKKSKRS